MNKNKPVPATNTDRVSMLTGFVKQLRLVWALFKDKRVPTWTKSVLPISLLYLISPIDFMPDVILGLGQLDDVAVILLGMTLFVKLCPPELVQHYVNKLEYGQDFYRNDDETVDTTYRVVGED